MFSPGHWSLLPHGELLSVSKLVSIYNLHLQPPVLCARRRIGNVPTSYDYPDD